MSVNNCSAEALRNIEKLKEDLGKKILKKIGKEKEENRIEPIATIFDKQQQPKSVKILVLGLNGYFNEKIPNDGLPRAVQPNYSYFEYFRKTFFAIQPENEKIFDEKEIGFFDLIPVRTGGKGLLRFDSFKEELQDEILHYLETGIKIFDPEIILTNSSDVGRFVRERFPSDDPKFGTTVTYFPIGDKNIPVILSGHLSGARTIDEFMRARIIREIREEMNRSKTKK